MLTQRAIEHGRFEPTQRSNRTLQIAGLFIAGAMLLGGLGCHSSGSMGDARTTGADWQPLFDGRSLDQWQSSTTEANVSLCWRIQDGQLCSVPSSERPEGAHASLLTKQTFSNFELTFDFKLDAPTSQTAVNSGVKYFVYPHSELGLEYQIYATTGKISGPHATGDLYDILPAHGAKLKPFDQWNTARIVSNGTTCEHWLNGVRVLTYERGGEAFRAAIARSKFKDRDHFGELPAGHIMLQDHGGGVCFRNIEIKQL